MHNSIKYIIKIVIIALLIGCLFKVPYAYFTITRVLVCVGFYFLAFKDEEESNRQSILGFGILLFQPIFKIPFGRFVWNVIDVVVAALMLIWIVIDLIKYLDGKRKGI